MCTNLKSKLCEMSFLLDLTSVTHCKTNLCVHGNEIDLLHLHCTLNLDLLNMRSSYVIRHCKA